MNKNEVYVGIFGHQHGDPAYYYVKPKYRARWRLKNSHRDVKNQNQFSLNPELYRMDLLMKERYHRIIYETTS